VLFTELQKLSDLHLDLGRVKVIMVRICGRGLPHTKLDQNRKNFLWMDGQMYGHLWMDKPEFHFIRSSLGDHLQIKINHWTSLFLELPTDSGISLQWLSSDSTWQYPCNKV